MPALVEASGTIWRHIVAAERRLRGIWAQGGQTYLPVYKRKLQHNIRRTATVYLLASYFGYQIFERLDKMAIFICMTGIDYLIDRNSRN